jgi:hypothetical protein
VNSYDLVSGEENEVSFPIRGYKMSVTFDGAIALVCDGSNLRVYDIEHGNNIFSSAISSHFPISRDISSDGQRFIADQYDGERKIHNVQVWKKQTSPPVYEKVGEGSFPEKSNWGGVSLLKISKDGQLALFATPREVSLLVLPK